MTPHIFDVVVRDIDAIRVLENASKWDATTLIAAVSSDPRSFHELRLSWLRYRPNQPLESLPWIERSGELQGNPPDWLLIDLACLRIESSVENWISMEPNSVSRDDHPMSSDCPMVWINIPPAWTIANSPDTPICLRELPVPPEPIDFRGVLYGRAMAENFARQIVERSSQGQLPAEYWPREELYSIVDRDDPRRIVSNRWYELTIQIHAAWLMTERKDLDGQCPRAFLHRHRDWAEREEHNRTLEWSRNRRPPRPLDRHTHTYRYGPMNRDEVVIYFDLCREVLQYGWALLNEQPALRTDEKRLGELLYDAAQEWLQHGSIEGDPLTPLEMIILSRQHMPRLSTGFHLDCECPLCRMIIESCDDEGMFYPTFSSFDGHHLDVDGEFAFSLHETREEFDQAEAEYREMSARIEKEMADRESSQPKSNSVWSGYVNPEIERVNLMTLGFRLAELIGDLKTARDAIGSESTNTSGQAERITAWIAGLNDGFDSLKHVGTATVDRRIAVEPMLDRLEDVGHEFPELCPKSADFQSLLHEWCRQPDFDDEIPF